MPELVGQTERTAQMRLQQEGRRWPRVAEIRSHDYAAEAVVAQDPRAAGRGDAVALLVNRAGGRQLRDARPHRHRRRARRRVPAAPGFRVAVVGNHPYPGVPAGIVIRQTPAGGFQIAPGEAISLEVSR